MSDYEQVNNVLTWWPICLAAPWALSQMIADRTVFTYIRFGSFSFHAYTALVLCLAYLVGCHRLRFLPVPGRQIYVSALLVAGIHLYDVWWGFGSIVSGNGGFPTLPIVNFLIAAALLVWLETRNMFLGETLWGWVFFGVCLICLNVMAADGFYLEMVRYTMGAGPDPNVGNLWWMVSKLSGFLVMPFASTYGRETREIRWSMF